MVSKLQPRNNPILPPISPKKKNNNKAFNCADKPLYNSYLEYRDKWPKKRGPFAEIYIFFYI